MLTAPFFYSNHHMGWFLLILNQNIWRKYKHWRGHYTSPPANEEKDDNLTNIRNWRERFDSKVRVPRHASCKVLPFEIKIIFFYNLSRIFDKTLN